MKKLLLSLLCVSLLLTSLTACSGGGKQAGNVDLDLSVMSGTAVYSEVYNMLNTPKNYEGKLIKVKGEYNVFTNSADESLEYYAVIIRDALQCCQQGIEFVLKDGSKPDLKVGTEVQVVGTFNTYYEGEQMYCHLENADLEVLGAAPTTAAGDVSATMKQAAVDIVKRRLSSNADAGYTIKSFENEDAVDTGKLTEDGTAALYTVTLTALTYTDDKENTTPVDFTCTVAVQQNGNGWFVEQVEPAE